MTGMTGCTAVLLVALAAQPHTTHAALERMEWGDFKGALSLLDTAVRSTSDSAELAKLHLARAQALSALQRHDEVDAAFTHALTWDPEARLDPSQVHPRLVSRLEELRSTLRGIVEIASPEGAELRIDGLPVGTVPLRRDVSIGRHHVEVKLTDGREDVREVLVRVGEVVRLSFVLAPAGPAATPEPVASVQVPPEPRMGVGAEARLNVEPSGGLSAELGPSISRGWLRASLSVVRGAAWGGTARFGFGAAPGSWHGFGVQGSLDAIAFFPERVVPGLGATLQALYIAGPVEPFVEVSGRMLLNPGEYQGSYLLFGAGARVKFAEF